MAEAAGGQPEDDIVEIAKELFSSSNENPAPVEANVIGKIPDWFQGSLLRVGPGDNELRCRPDGTARLFLGQDTV